MGTPANACLLPSVPVCSKVTSVAASVRVQYR